jgi:outer membrane immunogenic protein
MSVHNWADLKGSTQNLGAGAAAAGSSVASRVDAYGLITAQLGYAWNNVLIYAKGGAGVVDRRYDFIVNASGLSGATSG